MTDQITVPPLQGLAAYLRCEAGGVFVGSPNHETLMQWAREVDALTAANAVQPQAQSERGICGEIRGACGLPCEPCEGKPDPEWVTKNPQATEPADYKLVPVEPTPEMIASVGVSGSGDYERLVWQRMLSAAKGTP